jgi:hypothetical protein
MARVHGKDVNFTLNGVSIEDELNSVVMNVTVNEAELTAFNDAWQNFIAGKYNTQTEIAGSWDGAASQGDATIFALFGGGHVSTIFDPTGAGPDTNDPEYQSTASGLTGALLRQYTINLPVGGAASYTASIQHSGAMVRATA